MVFNSLGRFKVLVSEKAAGAVGATNEFACTLAVLGAVGIPAAVVGPSGVTTGEADCFGTS